MITQQYTQYLSDNTPPTRVLRNTFIAYIVGGAICTLGELFYSLFERVGLPEDDSSAAVSMLLIFLSAALTAMRLYDKLAVHAGAGTLVPITGFANAVVSPAMEFKSEGYLAGLGGKIFSIVGPVLVFGLLVSTVFGLFLALYSALFY